MSGAEPVTGQKRNRAPNKPNNASQYIGVSKVNNKWVAQFKLKGKTHYLKLHATELQAAIAYDNGVMSAIEENIITDNIPKWMQKLNFGNPRLPEVREKISDLLGEQDLLNELAPILSEDYVNLTNIEFKRKPKSSIYTGVSYYIERNIWKASIQYKGVKHYIGRFGTQEDAARAYNNRVRELYVEHKDPNILGRLFTVPDVLPIIEAADSFKINKIPSNPTPDFLEELLANFGKSEPAVPIGSDSPLNFNTRIDHLSSFEDSFLSELVRGPSPLILPSFNSKDIDSIFANLDNDNQTASPHHKKGFF